MTDDSGARSGWFLSDHLGCHEVLGLVSLEGAKKDADWDKQFGDTVWSSWEVGELALI